MSRRTLSLITVSLVLVAATAATADSAGKPVTPKLGFYESSITYSPLPEAMGGTVVKIGKGQAAEFSGSFGLTCPHSSGDAIPRVGFHWPAETPIPIKNGKFAFNGTIHSGAIEAFRAGVGTGTTRLVISGTFKSATKVVVKTSVTGSYNFHYFDEEQPNVKVECTGKQTATAKFKHH